MTTPESILIVTQRTALEDLIARFNTRSQAEFYIEQTAKQNPAYKGGAFTEYQQAHDAYHVSLEALLKLLPRGVKQQSIERSFLPNFKFSGHDLVITLGRDGLVINTAKYLTTELILALNPDPARVDGVLIPFQVTEARLWLERAFLDRVKVKPVSMAKAELNDGQVLYAVNDLFIGARTHVSARYSIEFNRQTENHSSSGIIVSTGAGSTGWLQSIVTGAFRIAKGVSQSDLDAPPIDQYRLDWSSSELTFAVREPFTSKTSQANMVFGKIAPAQKMILTSFMPDYGVIFSDGLEADYLNFNSGAVASIGLAERKANLIIRS
ncbi:MAG TPA: sugar kinase [Anaerolineae bacterium]|nr:sugar kinase [Anaerolineae bacterium]